MKYAFSTCVVGVSVSTFMLACGGGADTPAGTGAGVLGVGGSTVVTGNGGATSFGTGSATSFGTGATLGGSGASSFGSGGSSLTGSGGAVSKSGGGIPGGSGGPAVGIGGMPVPGAGGSMAIGGSSTGNGGAMSSGGAAGSGGASGGGGSVGTGGGGGPGVITGGKCCASGNCLCHGPDPKGPTNANGPYKTASFAMSTGTVYYPTDAEPPLAAVSICPGFLNVGPEMAPWGPFYASHGIVCVVTNTGAADIPAIRGNLLVGAINDLKKQNTNASSPLKGKLAGRYGTSGYSMGGGGTTFASQTDPTLMSSVGLAAWGPDGATVKTPTLFICSDADTVAGCLGSTSSYAAIKEPTAKMVLNIPGASHFNWFGPNDAGGGVSGAYALAFNKVYLEGDERWKPILLSKPRTGTITTNIK